MEENTKPEDLSMSDWFLNFFFFFLPLFALMAWVLNETSVAGALGRMDKLENVPNWTFFMLF